MVAILGYQNINGCAEDLCLLGFDVLGTLCMALRRPFIQVGLEGPPSLGRKKVT